jgi:very-short-patch-repair endonuclease
MRNSLPRLLPTLLVSAMNVPDEKTCQENAGWLNVYRMVMKKWLELAIDELDKDQARVPQVDILEQLYYRAKWEKYVDVMMATNTVLKRYEGEREKIELVAWMFGDSLGIPGSSIAFDVERRLDWYKARIAKRFDRTVRETLSGFGVASPIEQLFVMEWHYQQVEERHGVELQPQKKLVTDTGEFNIDFVIDRKAAGLLPLAIELDGHEFHEKTKTQASWDRKRERSIVRAGYLVIRFTGHEIFQDAGKCVREVSALLPAPAFSLLNQD